MILTNALGFMNVVLLCSNHWFVWATAVSIFRVSENKLATWVERTFGWSLRSKITFVNPSAFFGHFKINFMHLINAWNIPKCMLYFLSTCVSHFVPTVGSQLQLRSIVRNQTGIEDWIVEKAHHRRNPGDPKFVFPYNLGWKNNLKQVR